MVAHQLDLFGGPLKPPKKIKVDEDVPTLELPQFNNDTDDNAEQVVPASDSEKNIRAHHAEMLNGFASEDAFEMQAILTGHEAGETIDQPGATLPLGDESFEITAALTNNMDEAEEVNPETLARTAPKELGVIDSSEKKETFAEKNNISEALAGSSFDSNTDDSFLETDEETAENPTTQELSEVENTEANEYAANDTEKAAFLPAESDEITPQPIRKTNYEYDDEAGILNVPPDEQLFKRQYYSMRETAAMFSVNQSMLRFWENEFDILQPKKNKKGDRYFRPVDIKNLVLIYHLLRIRKFTMEGAKEYLLSNKKAGDSFELIRRLEKIKTFLLELKAGL